jgi:hypothetical protein
VSPKDPEKKDLEKRVRSLTTLTAKIAVPACLATAFDSTHPLPKVHDLQPEEIFYSLSFSHYILLMLCTRNFARSSIYGFTPSSSRGRAHQCWSRSRWLWSPRGWWESGRGWSRRFSRGKRLHFVAP